MVDIFGYLRGKLGGRKSSSVYRNKKLETYRKGLIESINNSKRKGGKNWKTDVYQMLEQEKTTDEYVLAKYGIDKKGALAVINLPDSWRGYNIFCENIDEFTGLDEEVAIKILEKWGWSYCSIIWNNLDKFSIGDKFLINYFDKYEWNKTEMLVGIVYDKYRRFSDDSYIKKTRYGEEFIGYLQKNNIGNEEMIWYLKVPLLDKKEKFDENDAKYINEVVQGFSGEKKVREEIKKWIERNILKFTNKSLDYSVFKLFLRTEYYYGRYGDDDGCSIVTDINAESFKKFKIYDEHRVGHYEGQYFDRIYTYSMSHTPGDKYDSNFERLYYKVYESPLIRDKELQRMKEMSFGDLLSLFVSKDDSGKKEVKEGEIMDMLLSKEVKNGEIREADLSKLYRMIDDGKIQGVDKKTKEEFLKKLRFVDLI